MRILVACETSGIVRRAFARKGHEVFSCDLLPSEDNSPNHIIGNVLDNLEGWDMIIAHPPCTYICSSGLHWISRGRIESDGRPRKVHQEEALEFVTKLWNAPCDKICIENPVGCLNTKLSFLPKPQYIQPWQFGEDASKKTGLWLKNLPQLKPTKTVIKDRYANQTPTGQNNLGPSKDRWRLRSKTYEGIANGMAEQWSINEIFYGNIA